MLDDRKELQKKVPLFITCLSRVNKEHKCPVGLCSNCSALHNILLCPKERTSKVLTIGESDDDKEESDGYDEDEYERNMNDHVYLTGKKEDSKTSDSSKKTGKDGKEKIKKDAETWKEPEALTTEVEEKEKKLSKL